ncbi:MAG: hypothetical protein JSU68_09405 [Phycisphaerales bacterium]|nr:MAG: hypothetical protein JSU68_09405 [Phycisphaerales bacterium]
MCSTSDSANQSPGEVRQFVIQHHQLPDGEHWDLMIEAGDVLWTWQLGRPPQALGRDPVPALRIGDHRKAYLTYEGPISGDRGTVRIAERGTCRVLEETKPLLRLELQGRKVTGRFELRRQDAESDRWVLAPAGPP